MDKDIEKAFEFLVKDCGLKYKYQAFYDAFHDGRGWNIFTYSYYNESGCFTIHTMPQRGELDFYYSEKISTNFENLYEKSINVATIEKEIWEKHSKIWIFNRPFFWWSTRRVVQALAEVLKVHIAKHGEFCGIKIDDNMQNL